MIEDLKSTGNQFDIIKIYTNFTQQQDTNSVQVSIDYKPVPTLTLKTFPHILPDIIFKGLWVFINRNFKETYKKYKLHICEDSTFMNILRGYLQAKGLWLNFVFFYDVFFFPYTVFQSYIFFFVCMLPAMNVFNWSAVGLQCCASFPCTADIYISDSFPLIGHCKIQLYPYSLLYHTVSPCWLSISYIVVHIC